MARPQPGRVSLSILPGAGLGGRRGARPCAGARRRGSSAGPRLGGGGAPPGGRAPRPPAPRGGGRARPLGRALRALALVTGGGGGLELLGQSRAVLDGSGWRLEHARTVIE